MKGTFIARAVSWGITKSSTGKQRAEVKFQIKDQQVQRTWYGYFTENTAERTLKSLEYCGWNGGSLKEFARGPEFDCGMGSRDVELDIFEETFEGETRDKIRWVNEIKRIVSLPSDELDELDARLLKNRKQPAQDPFA